MIPRTSAHVSPRGRTQAGRAFGTPGCLLTETSSCSRRFLAAQVTSSRSRSFELLKRPRTARRDSSCSPRLRSAHRDFDLLTRTSRAPRAPLAVGAPLPVPPPSIQGLDPSVGPRCSQEARLTPKIAGAAEDVRSTQRGRVLAGVALRWRAPAPLLTAHTTSRSPNKLPTPCRERRCCAPSSPEGRVPAHDLSTAKRKTPVRCCANRRSAARWASPCC